MLTQKRNKPQSRYGYTRIGDIKPRNRRIEYKL
jgi:hypothetical protein